MVGMKLPNYRSIAAQYIAGYPWPPRLLTCLVCYLSVFQLREAMVAMVPMETALMLALEYTAACVT